MTKSDTEIAERFKRDTASHEMTVLHDDGVYRHLRFKKPGTSFYWFDLVTWPGSLTITGDCGTYVFTRDTDMFEFFRDGSTYGINPHYWGEKLPGGRQSAKRYSADYALQRVTEAIDEFEKCGGSADIAVAARDRVKLAQLDDVWCGEDSARELLADLEQAGVVSDTWEWDLHDYEWSFLWCCHAIVSGIEQYDASRAAVTR